MATSQKSLVGQKNVAVSDNDQDVPLRGSNGSAGRAGHPLILEICRNIPGQDTESKLQCLV